MFHRGDPRIVYRSWFRLLVWVPFSLALGAVAVGAGLEEDPGAFVFLPVAVIMLVWVLWSRLVLDQEGLQVRNWTTVTIPWIEVREPVIAAQLPLLGRFWRAVGSFSRAPSVSGGKSGYPGLVIHTRTRGSVAVSAVQLHPLRETGFPDRVLAEVEAARHAARNWKDPVEAARTSRSLRRRGN